ncbi:MAG: endonuclease domain-containing protein [Flavobacteriales bacterium]
MKADKSNYYAYNRDLQPFANKLRKDMTKAEACLWKYALKARKMKGYQFRRQRPVLNFIADFMCKELKLVLEVDGPIHDLEETKIKDLKKDIELSAAGFKVVRFTNEQVLRQIGWVIDEIESVISEIETSTPVTPGV